MALNRTSKRDHQLQFDGKIEFVGIVWAGAWYVHTVDGRRLGPFTSYDQATGATSPDDAEDGSTVMKRK